LYWVTTDDHDEDWFILARTSRTAESHHIQYEGYEPGDARAELILRAGTDSNPGTIPRHAQLEDLQTLGFEGHLEPMVTEVRDDAVETLGSGRPWGTTRRREN
jgi:hypothetical protein